MKKRKQAKIVFTVFIMFLLVLPVSAQQNLEWNTETDWKNSEDIQNISNAGENAIQQGQIKLGYSPQQKYLQNTLKAYWTLDQNENPLIEEINNWNAQKNLGAQSVQGILQTNAKNLSESSINLTEIGEIGSNLAEENITLSKWFKAEENTTQGTLLLAENTEDQTQLIVFLSSSRITIQIRDSAGDRIFARTEDEVPKNQWNQITFVKTGDEAEDLEIWLNGEQENLETAQDGPLQQTSNFNTNATLGGETSNGETIESFNGTIDHFKIHNTALNQSQIRKLNITNGYALTDWKSFPDDFSSKDLKLQTDHNLNNQEIKIQIQNRDSDNQIEQTDFITLDERENYDIEDLRDAEDYRLNITIQTNNVTESPILNSAKIVEAENINLTNIEPGNNTLDNNLNPDLTVNITNPGDIEFYNAENNNLIGAVNDVDCSNCSVTLNSSQHSFADQHGTVFEWYATGINNFTETNSTTTSFRTINNNSELETEQHEIRVIDEGETASTVNVSNGGRLEASMFVYTDLKGSTSAYVDVIQPDGQEITNIELQNTTDLNNSQTFESTINLTDRIDFQPGDYQLEFRAEAQTNEGTLEQDSIETRTFQVQTSQDLSEKTSLEELTTSISPEDEEVNVGIQEDLEITLNETLETFVNVEFEDTDTGQIMETHDLVAPGETVSANLNLENGTTYNWNVEIEDGYTSFESDTREFTTIIQVLETFNPTLEALDQFRNSSVVSVREGGFLDIKLDVENRTEEVEAHITQPGGQTRIFDLEVAATEPLELAPNKSAGANISDYTSKYEESDPEVDAIVTDYSDDSGTPKYLSITSAVEDQGEDTTIFVAEQYDPENEALPIDLNFNNLEIVTETGPTETIIGNKNHLGTTDLIFETEDIEMERKPGAVTIKYQDTEGNEQTFNYTVKGEGENAGLNLGLQDRNNFLLYENQSIQLNDGLILGNNLWEITSLEDGEGVDQDYELVLENIFTGQEKDLGGEFDSNGVAQFEINGEQYEAQVHDQDYVAIIRESINEERIIFPTHETNSGDRIAFLQQNTSFTVKEQDLTLEDQYELNLPTNPSSETRTVETPESGGNTTNHLEANNINYTVYLQHLEDNQEVEFKIRTNNISENQFRNNIAVLILQDGDYNQNTLITEPRQLTENGITRGEGTGENPYLVSNCRELQDIRQDTSAYYNLTSDIDCGNTSNWYNGQGFEPIDSFTGVLNGNNHTIKSLRIQRNEENTGIFSQVDSSAIIRDLKISNADVESNRYLGVLVGTLQSGTITNVHLNHSKVDMPYSPSGSDEVGGLVGMMTGGTIEKSSVSNSKVINEDGDDTGGLVGDHNTGGGLIAQSHVNNVTVLCADSCGGLVGELDSSSSVEDSYAVNINVTATNSGAGGLVGEYDDQSSSITRSFAAGGTVEGPEQGGLVSNSEGSSTDNYWDTELASSSGAGTELNREDMQGNEAESNMPGLDFENVLSATESDFPVHQWSQELQFKEFSPKIQVRTLEVDYTADTSQTPLTVDFFDQIITTEIISGEASLSTEKIGEPLVEIRANDIKLNGLGFEVREAISEEVNAIKNTGTNTEIKNAVFKGNKTTDPLIHTDSSITVTSSNFTGKEVSGIHLTGTNNQIQITNNHFNNIIDGITSDTSNTEITNNTFQNITNNAVYIESSGSNNVENIRIQENTFKQSGNGINLNQLGNEITTNLSANFNLFNESDRDGYAIRTAESGSSTGEITGDLNATYNWWNHETGPSGFGPGIGDQITQNFTFTPWLGEKVGEEFLTKQFNKTIDVENDLDVQAGTYETQLRAIKTFEDGTIYREINPIMEDFWIKPNHQFTTFQDEKWAFTNCGATGATGPTNQMCQTEYQDTELEGEIEVENGIQYWQPPTPGRYNITAHGAEGGGFGDRGGHGASVSGTFDIMTNEPLQILVGQRGQVDDGGDSSRSYTGGGGGSFVTTSNPETTEDIFVIAGGGGGVSHYSPNPSNAHGTISEDGMDGVGSEHSAAGGTDGGAGDTAGDSWKVRGGAGFFEDSNNIQSYLNGGQSTSGYASEEGGFGSGGAAVSEGSHSRAAGGGGYSGGGAGRGTTGDREGAAGGGGGSYNTGSFQVNASGNNTGHGEVQVQLLEGLEFLDSITVEDGELDVPTTRNMEFDISADVGGSINVDVLNSSDEVVDNFELAEPGETLDVDLDLQPTRYYTLYMEFEDGVDTFRTRDYEFRTISDENHLVTRDSTFDILDSEQQQTSYFDADESGLVNTSLFVYRNKDMKTDEVWLEIEDPVNNTEKVFLENTTTSNFSQTYVKEFDLLDRIDFYKGEYTVTYHANSTLDDGTEITEQTTFSETFEVVESPCDIGSPNHECIIETDKDFQDRENFTGNNLLEIRNNAEITHENAVESLMIDFDKVRMTEGSEIRGNVDIIAENFVMSENSVIDASQLGYDQGEGPGAPEDLNCGAGFGAPGGNVSTCGISGQEYSQANYVLAEGEGYGSGSEGSGGGRVTITSQNTELNGSMLADGEIRGSGGGIQINSTQSVNGTGEIFARGGDRIDSDNARGAGGRIAIITTNYTQSLDKRVFGGQGVVDNVEGTVFVGEPETPPDPDDDDSTEDDDTSDDDSSDDDSDTGGGGTTSGGSEDDDTSLGGGLDETEDEETEETDEEETTEVTLNLAQTEIQTKVNEQTTITGDITNTGTETNTAQVQLTGIPKLEDESKSSELGPGDVFSFEFNYVPENTGTFNGEVQVDHEGGIERQNLIVEIEEENLANIDASITQNENESLSYDVELTNIQETEEQGETEITVRDENNDVVISETTSIQGTSTRIESVLDELDEPGTYSLETTVRFGDQEQSDIQEFEITGQSQLQDYLDPVRTSLIGLTALSLVVFSAIAVKIRRRRNNGVNIEINDQIQSTLDELKKEKIKTQKLTSKDYALRKIEKLNNQIDRKQNLNREKLIARLQDKARENAKEGDIEALRDNLDKIERHLEAE